MLLGKLKPIAETLLAFLCGVSGRSTCTPRRCGDSFAGQPCTGASNPPHPRQLDHHALAATLAAARRAAQHVA
jgi:hypothetical protein